MLGGTVFGQMRGSNLHTPWKTQDGCQQLLQAEPQTGAVTAAGVGLMNLGGMVFGSEADQRKGTTTTLLIKLTL